MGSSPSTPSIPSWQDVSASQQQYNTQSGLQSQAGSMVNQSNPYGSLNYSQTGTDAYGNPIYGANMQYNAPTQQLFNQAQGAAGSIGGAVSGLTNAAMGTIGQAGQQYGLGGNAANQSNALIDQGMGMLQGANYNPATIAQNTQGITNQMMGSELNSLSPTFNMQTQQAQADLENRGIMPGTDAYNNQMRQVQLNQGQTMSGFLAQAQPQAYNEAQSMFTMPYTLGQGMVQSGQGLGQLGQGYTQTGYGANASGAGLYGAAGSGLGAMQSMIPGMSTQLTSTPGLSIQAANPTAAANSYDTAVMQQYQAQMAQQNSIYQALGSVGGAAVKGLTSGAGAAMAA